MEKYDNIKYDILGKMLHAQPLESPSDDFVKGIMAKIQPAPAMVPAHKPFFLFIRSSWSFAMLSLAVVIFVFTSDLPFINNIPGKSYISNSLLPYISSLFTGALSYFGGMKSISIPIMIVVAVTFLLLLDHWVFRKPKMQNSMIF
jgi:hypothetical protein